MCGGGGGGGCPKCTKDQLSVIFTRHVTVFVDSWSFFGRGDREDAQLSVDNNNIYIFKIVNCMLSHLSKFCCTAVRGQNRKYLRASLIVPDFTISLLGSSCNSLFFCLMLVSRQDGMPSYTV